MNFFVDSLVGGQAAASQRPVARQPRPPWSRSSGTWILKGARRHVLRLPRALATRRERPRSEEHTSELQSLMRISYAVFCLKKKKTNDSWYTHTNSNSQIRIKQQSSR